MAETLSTIRDKLRQDLKDEDAGNYRWTDAELNRHIEHAVWELSQYLPREMETILDAVDDSVEVDIESLDNVVRVTYAEHPLGSNPRSFRNFTVWGDALTMKLDSYCSVDEETLTGTVSFTSGSTSISGSGTSFSSEVEAGEYIKKSTDDDWYEVSSVGSDTALTLVESYGGSTGDDSTGSTPLRSDSGVVRVYWEKEHTLDGSTCTVPGEAVNLLLGGAAAYATMAWANYSINQVNIGGDVKASYLEWARSRLGMFYGAVRKRKKLRTYRDWPTEL